MPHESRTVAEPDGRTVRPSHAKSTALVKGVLTVLQDLAGPLRQGLFAQPRSYPMLMRFGQGPGERLSDGVSTRRGVGIKVLGVAGMRLPGHHDATRDSSSPPAPPSRGRTLALSSPPSGASTGPLACRRPRSERCPPPRACSTR